MVLDMENSMFNMDLFGRDNPGILHLEKSLLDLSISNKVAQGIFYMLPIYHSGKLYVR